MWGERMELDGNVAHFPPPPPPPFKPLAALYFNHYC